MEALTYSTVAVTLGLVVARPRLGPRVRLSPAMAALAGVAALAAVGSVRLDDVAWAARAMGRPLAGVVAIMTMAGVARRLGVLDGIAAVVFQRARSASRLFALVFAFGALTAAVLNNDAAILLVTPLVVDAARRRRPELAVPLAFAVFLSAGVAPLVVSNPMNLVVASFAGIGFNEYAARMALPALASGAATFVVARAIFHRALASSGPLDDAPAPPRLGAIRRAALVTLAATVLAYPIVSALGGPVWLVAIAGALALLAVASRAGVSPREALAEVHVDTLVFLLAALVLSIGLRNVGVVERLARVYDGASTLQIGMTSALGSALVNNHPMANLNMFAIARGDHTGVLAALVGGDLGPRLFPMGSLAGLLWLETLRRSGVAVGTARFVVVGALATAPALVAALLLL